MLINVILIKECISSSHGEQYGSWRKEQTKNWWDILIVITKYSKLSLEIKLLIFDCFALLYKLLYIATAACYYIIFTKISVYDTCVWLGSFLSFGQKFMGSGVAIGLS